MRIAVSVATGSATVYGDDERRDSRGGADGVWLTDLNATPRLNRAARDWTRSYIAALKGYGIEVTVAFSMELRNGDDRAAAAIAQRYPGWRLLSEHAGAADRISDRRARHFGSRSIAIWRT